MSAQVGADPLSAFRPLLEGTGWLDRADRVRRGMALHATLPRPPVGVTAHEVVHRQGSLELRYYAPTGPSTGTPVVVVPSLINRAYICDLAPGRSLVAGLAALGHPVYLVDWGVPTEEQASQDVGWVLLELLDRAVFRACHHYRAPQVFLLGYCQGGTLSAMYAALRPQRLRGLAVFNAPVRFSEAGRFRRWVDPEHFSVEEAIDPERLMPVEAMQVGFKLLDPMGLWAKYQALDAATRDPRVLSQSLSQEKWLEENVPMAGAFAAEFIREAYQNDALLKGEWVIRGQAVDLRQIRCPLFVVAARKDFICPAAAAMPLAEATSSADVHAEVLDTGHIGIVVGSFGPRVFYPMLDRWFRARLPA